MDVNRSDDAEPAKPYAPEPDHPISESPHSGPAPCAARRPARRSWRPGRRWRVAAPGAPSKPWIASLRSKRRKESRPTGASAGEDESLEEAWGGLNAELLAWEEGSAGD